MMHVTWTIKKHTSPCFHNILWAFCPLILLVSGCASTVSDSSRAPEWVNGNSQKFPKAMYLSGQGVGGSASDAKDRARSDLAKQFEVSVIAHSQQTQTFSSTTEGGATQKTLAQRVSRQLLTRTSKTLEGVEVAEQWYDEANGEHYALAILSRPRAQKQFEQTILSLDEIMEQSLKAAETEDDYLRRAALVQRGIDAQERRRSVQSSLQVVDGSGRGKPPKVSLAELARARDDLLSRVVIYTSIESNVDDTTGVSTADFKITQGKMLKAAISNAGFSHGAESSASHRLIVKLELDPDIVESGWHWIRGTMQVTLVSSDAKELGIQRWPLKVSATTSERAKQRILTAFDRNLNENLRQTLMSFVLP